jgi:putative endonuclease
MKDEKLFCVYIVANRSRVLYVGVTSDLYQRVQQHRKGIYERFTSRYACNRLVWFERFTGPNEAIAREKQIKRWRRENPTWEDLAADWGLPIPLYSELQTPADQASPVEKQISPLRAARSGRNDSPSE